MIITSKVNGGGGKGGRHTYALCWGEMERIIKYFSCRRTPF